MLYCFASNKPRRFGVFKVYAKEDIDELLSHYEEDLKEGAAHLDEKHLTRLALGMYLLKTPNYENILWRIEARTQELASGMKAETATEILRSFSHMQENKMYGHKKTFTMLEKSLLNSKLTHRQLTQSMYAYSVRNFGNPELHDMFLKELSEQVEQMDYPSLSNAVYYLLFRGNKD